MKLLERITLTIYSCLMLILAIITCLIIFGWIDISLIGNIVQNALKIDLSSKIILGVSIIFILLSIKCIFFGSDSKESLGGEGILLENSNGKLMISKDTLESLVNSVANGFESTEGVKTRVDLDEENNVNVYVNLIVGPNAIIKDLSSNLQTQIKDKIKTATDLDVKEVNIQVQNVVPKTETQNS